MRILHLSSWFQPQLGYSELHMTTAMKRLGCEVLMVTSDRYFPFPDYDATVRPLLGERIVGPRCGKEYGLNTYRLPVAFEYRHHLWMRGLRKVIQEFKPDIVLTYQTFTLPTLQVSLLKSEFGFSLITRSSMEKAVFDEQTLSRRVFYYFFTRFAAPILRRRVDRFTAVGPGAKEIVQRVVEVPAERIEIVPLGADSELFQFNAAARLRIRGELGINDDAFVVVYAGKLIPRKDVHVLVGAVSKLAIPCTLLLIGDGTDEYKRQLGNLVATSSVARLVFHQPVPNAELAGLLSVADVAVWPSESSNTAIEAAMMGLPIVVCDDPGSRHYVAQKNGYTFRRGDVALLTKQLTELATNATVRREMGERGKMHFNETLSWRAIAKSSLASYEGLLVARENSV